MARAMQYKASEGNTSPLGATPLDGGVNFSIYSRSATGFELVFYEHEDDLEPSQTFRLNPEDNKTFHYWHIFVHGARVGQLYGWRALGEYKPEHGHYFDESKILLDPYTKFVTGFKNYSREQASIFGKETGALKCMVVAPFEI